MSADASERFSAIQSEIYHHGYDRGYKKGRADAIDDFADSVVLKIGLLKQSANDQWVEYSLNEIKKFVMNKAYELKEQT